jgi:hypothetical protein
VESRERPKIPLAVLESFGFRSTAAGVWVPGQAKAQTAPANGEVAVFIPHSTVFPGLPDDFAELKRLLRTLSRTDTILWCARLNLLVSDSTTQNPKDVEAYCIRRFFSDDQIRLINDFAKERGGRQRVSVFFRGQLLQLLRWATLLCPDLPEDGRTFDSADTRRSFARAALLASEVWGRRIYGDRLAAERPLDALRLDVLPLTRLASMETTRSPNAFMAIARGASLFADRLRVLIPEAEALFHARTGLPIDDYFSIVTDIASRGLGKGVEGLGDPDKSGLMDVGAYERAASPLGEISREFFSRQSQTADELQRAFWGKRVDAEERDGGLVDVAPLRSKPIFRAEDGRAIILDLRSFVESASAGPLFQLLRAGGVPPNRLFGAFGEVFEAYARDTLRRMYPDVPGLVRRFVPNPMARDKKGNLVELCDGVFLGNDVAVFFELKGVWLKDSTSSPDADPSAYLAHIHERYGVVDSPEPGERRVKGFGQLARAVARLADGSWKLEDGLDLGGVRRLIPALVAHDTHLDAPVHSHILAREFAALLGPPSEPGTWTEALHGPFRVAHLVLLTLDDLETLETSSEHFGMVECLDEYVRAAPDRLTPFHNFLATSRFRQHLRYNKWLATRCTDILDGCIARLFPSKSSENSGGDRIG